MFISDVENSIVGMCHFLRTLFIRHLIFPPESFVEDAGERAGAAQTKGTLKQHLDREQAEKAEDTAGQSDCAAIEAIDAAEESIRNIMYTARGNVEMWMFEAGKS